MKEMLREIAKEIIEKTEKQMLASYLEDFELSLPCAMKSKTEKVKNQ